MLNVNVKPRPKTSAPVWNAFIVTARQQQEAARGVFRTNPSHVDGIAVATLFPAPNPPLRMTAVFSLATWFCLVFAYKMARGRGVVRLNLICVANSGKLDELALDAHSIEHHECG